MKNIIIKNKKKIIIWGIWFLITLAFFGNRIFMCWDSSVYLGMSLVLGTAAVKDVWLPVRGISFPLLLRLFEPMGWQNKYLLLLMFYIFYMGLLYVIYKIGKKLDLYNNKSDKIIYLVFVLVFVIINPYIFVYYHLVLTEFIAITLNMVFVYLMYLYIRLDIKKDMKKLVLYGSLMSLIVIFLYHTKQSFLGMMVIEFALGVLLSFFRHFDIKNISFRIINVILCGLLLFGTVKVWNHAMNGVGLNNSTEVATEAMPRKRLITGITKLKFVANSKNLTYDEGEFFNSVILISRDSAGISSFSVKNKKTENEMIKVLNNESKYKEFSVYTANDEMFVLFTKNNYGLVEQLPLYFRLFVTRPNLIISSYYDGIYKTVWIPGYWSFENKAFTYNYYRYSDENLIHIAPGYEYAVNDLKEVKTFNIIDGFEFGLAVILSPVYRANQMIVPILFFITFIILIWVSIKSKKNKEYSEIRNGFEMIVLLYGMSFGCIITYIIFSAFLDRYLMPSHVPMFIGDILLVFYIIRIIKIKKSSY